MVIGGLAKLTLLDFPGKVACTVFLGGCNFRCPFCHNAPLVLAGQQSSPVSREELFAFLQKRAGMLEGVCVSGGEPLIWQETASLLRDVRALGYSVKLDTNGSFPDRLGDIISQGLVDYVAMDLKAAPENYPRAVGGAVDTDAVCRSADMLREGKVPFEFRTTLVRGLHTVDDIRGIGGRFGGDFPYFLQNYAAPQDAVGDVSAFAPFERGEMAAMLAAARAYFPRAEIRGE